MSEDTHDSNNSGESTDAGNTFPACSPEQDKALARLRAIAVHVQTDTNPAWPSFLDKDGIEYRRYTDGRVGYERVTPLFDDKGSVIWPESGNNQVPGNVLQDWVRIDQERTELERMYGL